MRQRISLLSALLWILLPFAAHAQFDNGSIVGTVHEHSCAVVPGAAVTVTTTATGVVSTATTQGSGDYEIPNLRVGEYDVTIAHEGFTDAHATNISVTVGGRQRIDLTLEVGQNSTTVQVSGVALQ